MRVLVFEHITGGGLLGEPLPASLAAEGDVMLRALLRDLAALPGIELHTTRDARMPALEVFASVATVSSVAAFESAFARELAYVDAVWPIAPETGDILATLCESIVAAGRRLLNCPPAAVRLTASKHATLRYLAARDVPVIASAPLAAGDAGWGGPVVVKPDDGVGCVGIRVFPNIGAARQWATVEAHGARLIAQPYHSGRDASLSLICHRGAAELLSVNRQVIERAGDTLVLHRVEVGAFNAEHERLQPLADAVARAIPDLWGFVGVDLLLTESGPEILEINPRLTSAYPDIVRTTGINPAQRVLGLPVDLPSTAGSRGEAA